jgi:hypothetical protein
MMIATAILATDVAQFPLLLLLLLLPLLLSIAMALATKVVCR